MEWSPEWIREDPQVLERRHVLESHEVVATRVIIVGMGQFTLTLSSGRW